MSFEWFVALRFLREGKTQTWLILIGVGVGIGVVVFLSALLNGLQANLIKQTLGSQAHITVRPPEEAPRILDEGGGAAVAAHVERPAQRVRSIEQWQEVITSIDRIPGVVATSPAVSGAAFASRGNASRSVALRGVIPELSGRIVDVEGRLKEGRFRLLGGEAVIGVELAHDLGVSVGDKLRVVVAEGRSEVFSVGGVFDMGNKDLNQRWVFVPLRAAQTLLDLAGGVSTIEVKVDSIFQADAIAAEAASRTGLVAESWMKVNAQLLTALRSQDSSKLMIQFFVTVAIALGIASVLVVSVVQKSREIGILRAFGTSTGRVMRVFLVQGLIVGLSGSLLGSALGAALASLFARMMKGPDGAPAFEVDLSPALFLRAALIAITTGLVAAVAPARRAARLDPATAIRHG